MLWNYASYLSPFIPEEFRLAGPELASPLYPLKKGESNPSAGSGQAHSAGSGQAHSANIWIKDESTHGTHKNRSFQYWISYHAMHRTKELLVSSSGNSAFAAAQYCQKANIVLHAFLRHDFPNEKKEQLEHMGVKVYLSKTPKRDAVHMSNAKSLPLLRASVDPLAIEGYKTLAFEIIEQVPSAGSGQAHSAGSGQAHSAGSGQAHSAGSGQAHSAGSGQAPLAIDEIFMPVSSATALVGLHKGYLLWQQEHTISIPRLYAVQTSMVHPIGEEFDSDFIEEDLHPARAIIDRISHRKKEAINLLTKTHGGGYVISKKDTAAAKHTAESLLGKEVGFESALTIAAVQKHREKHPEFSQAHTLCIFTN